MILLIQSSISTAEGRRRKYWYDTAIKFKMIDMPEGMRFSRIPEVFEDQFNHRNRNRNVVYYFKVYVELL